MMTRKTRALALTCLTASALVQTGCKPSQEQGKEDGKDTPELQSKPGELTSLPAGLLRFVPGQTEFLLAGRNWQEAGESLMAELDQEADHWDNGLILLIEPETGDLSAPVEDTLPIPDEAKPGEPLMKALGREFFFCGWNGAAPLVEKMGTLWNQLGELRVALIATGYAGLLKDEDSVQEELKSLVDQVLEGVALNTGMRMPSLLFALRAGNPNDGAAIKKQFLNTLRVALEENETSPTPTSREVNGGHFEGFSSETVLFGEDSPPISFTVLVGQVQENVFFYFGDQPGSLALPSRESESLLPVAAPLLWNQYADQDILGFSFVHRNVLKALDEFSQSQSPWSVASKVFEQNNLTFKQQDQITEKLMTLQELESTSPTKEFRHSASLIYLDDGIHYEKTGGVRFPDQVARSAWKIKDKSPPSTLSLHYRADEEERSRQLLYLEETTSLVYLLLKELFDPKIQDETTPSIVRAAQGKDVEERLISLYQAWKEQILPGLDPEYLIKADLKGHPSQEHGASLPRIAMIAPVRNWRSLAFGLSRISRDARELHNLLSPHAGIGKDWPVSNRMTEKDWSYYRTNQSVKKDAWDPAVGWNRDFFFLSSHEEFGQNEVQQLAIGEGSAGNGFLLEVNLGEILDHLWKWDEEARPINSDSLRFSELDFIRSRLSEMKYWSRDEQDRSRVSLEIKFR